MRVNLSGGGVPVSYSPPPAFATSDQRPCATQSTGGSTDVSSVDSFYSPSPKLPLDETAQPPQQPPHSHSHPNHTHSYPQAFVTTTFGAPIQTYQQPNPQIHSAASGQGMWLTPPAPSPEDFENYSYHGSPMSTNCAIQSAPSYSAHSSVNSPRSRSSPDIQQLNFQQGTSKFSNQLPFHTLRITSPTQHEDAFQPQMTIASPYGGALYPGPNIDSADSIMHPDAPPTIPDVPETDPGFSPPGESPQMKSEPSESSHFDEDNESPNPVPASDSDDTKGTKPYAQLIYHALMTTNDKMMALQDLYQWFRQNTDKTKGSGDGWMNSIRHNLSMNAAFEKRPDLKLSPGGSLSESRESKKNTEWHLADWAIREGVQSTTRYRKGNNNRRGGSSHQRAHGGNPSARANSGRKGGITASKTKAAASRKALAHGGRTNSSRAYYIPNSCQRGSAQETLYDRPFDYQYSSSARGEPVTPPDYNAGDMLIPDPTHASASQGYMYQGTLHQGQSHHHGYLQHHQQQPQQQHHYNPPPVSNFTIADVSGVYQGPPTSLSGRGQGASASIAPDFALFANADEMNMQWASPDSSGDYQS